MNIDLDQLAAELAAIRNSVDAATVTPETPGAAARVVAFQATRKPLPARFVTAEALSAPFAMNGAEKADFVTVRVTEDVLDGFAGRTMDLVVPKGTTGIQEGDLLDVSVVPATAREILVRTTGEIRASIMTRRIELRGRNGAGFSAGTNVVYSGWPKAQPIA